MDLVQRFEIFCYASQNKYLKSKEINNPSPNYTTNVLQITFAIGHGSQ